MTWLTPERYQELRAATVDLVLWCACATKILKLDEVTA